MPSASQALESCCATPVLARASRSARVMGGRLEIATEREPLGAGSRLHASRFPQLRTIAALGRPVPWSFAPFLFTKRLTADRYTGDGVRRPTESDRGWQITPVERRRQKVERHRRWIASLTECDWERLACAADETLAANDRVRGVCRARIDDLDASIAVAVIDPGEAHPPRGERFGVLRGCILMAWGIAPFLALRWPGKARSAR